MTHPQTIMFVLRYKEEKSGILLKILFDKAYPLLCQRLCLIKNDTLNQMQGDI